MLTGSELRFDIWRELSDHAGWEKYLEYFRREPAFDEEKRESLVEIYTFLKKELQKNYLEQCFKNGHTQVGLWLQGRGNHYSELKWLVEAMKYFKKRDCNYDKLNGHLKSIKRCRSEEH